MAVLELNGHAVLLVHQRDVEEAVQVAGLELLGQCRIGGNLLSRGDAGGVAVAALGNLLGDVAELQQAGAGGRLLHEGADARHALDIALGEEFAQRPVGGHAADAEAFDQLVLGGHARAGRPGAGADLGQDVSL